METDSAEKSGLFHPFGMVKVWSIVGFIVILMGVAQLFTIPQGSGFPMHDDFWHPVVPSSGLAAMAFALFLIVKGVVGFWRDAFLSTAIMSCAWTIGFGLMLFATAERPSIAEVQAPRVAPENAYTCARKADGGMECLNAQGEASPSYSYTVVKPKQSDP